MFTSARQSLDVGQELDLSKAIDSSALTATDWVVAGCVVVGGYAFSLLVRRIIVTVLRRSTSGASFAEVFVGRFVQASIMVVALIYALGVIGVQFAPLLGALGIGGIALALALQPTLENFFAGLVLHAQRPFRVGEEVITADVQGEVVDITTRSVVVRANSGETVHIPNSMVLGREIENLVRHGQRRTTVQVDVAYGTDVRVAREVIWEATIAATRGAETPRVMLLELGESGIRFDVDFWHGPLESERRAARDGVIEAVYEALGAASITIPFPQRTVWSGQPAKPHGD